MAIQSVSAAANVQYGKIQHETERQRHHVRVQVPAVVAIGPDKYTTDDISEGGFSIVAPKDIFENGQQSVKIFFPFHNFAFHLKLDAKPVYHNPSGGKVGFMFPEIDSRQLSLLNLVIKSSLSGEIANHGEFMEVLKHRNPPRPANYPHSKWGRLIPMGLIALIGTTGLILLGASIYENTSIVKSYTAVIEADTYMVRAQGEGVYSSLLAQDAKKVVKGQELAVLKSADAAPATTLNESVATPPPGLIIRSPCDCYVYKTYSKEGEFRSTGEPLFELVPVQANSWVTASIRPDQSHRLRLQDDAFVQVLGENKFLEGHISEFLPPNFETGTSQVRIRTTEPLPPQVIGQPAYVEFVIF